MQAQTVKPSAIETLEETLKFIKKIAPDVWAIYLRNQRLTALQYILWSISFAIGSRWLWIAASSYQDSPGRDLLFVAMGIAFIGCLATVISSITFLANPAHHAIKDLLSKD